MNTQELITFLKDCCTLIGRASFTQKRTDYEKSIYMKCAKQLLSLSVEQLKTLEALWDKPICKPLGLSDWDKAGAIKLNHEQRAWTEGLYLLVGARCAKGNTTKEEIFVNELDC